MPAHDARTQAARGALAEARADMSLTAIAATLRQQLAPLLPGLNVEVLATCPSTNTTLLDRARAGDATPCLLVAETQTQGRGRLGRSWLSAPDSAPGASLTFSLALPLALSDWNGLSLAVGVAVADALDDADDRSRIALKWPNDLWHRDAPGRGRKLGGILIETLVAAQQRVVVIGIGINVLPHSDEGLSHGRASLQEIDAQASAARALQTIATPLVRAVRRFETDGFAPFVAAYARRDLLRGIHVSTTLPTVPAGVAEGVDEHGALLVRVGADLHRISSGEVSVRLFAAAAVAKAEAGH